MGIIYYIICTLVARLFTSAERRVAIPGSLAAEIVGSNKDAILDRFKRSLVRGRSSNKD